MNTNEMITMTAKAIAYAHKEAKRNLQNRWSNPSIIQPDDNAKKRAEYDVENCFFEIVVAYSAMLSPKQYESLCTRIELLDERYCYRP